jgi:hypothetical protein
MKKTCLLSFIIILMIGFSGCEKFNFWDHGGGDQPAQKEDARVALDWYKLELRFLLERNSAMGGAYFGYLGIGLYESVRYISEHSVSFSAKLYQMPAMPAKENNKKYNWQVSANAAMADMLRSFNTGLTTANLASIDSLENVYSQLLEPMVGKEIFNRSQSYGKSIAAAVHSWSLTDNFNTSNAGYVPPVFPGSWVPTPPAFANGVNAYVSAARPFLVADLTAIAPPFPVAYSEDPGSEFYAIVKNDYSVSQTLTQEQKDIALFWVDQGNGLGFTPDGHNLSIILQALEQHKDKVSLGIAAEALAKAGIADREAIIVTFRSKYAYNLLRPVTYIRKVIDPNWLPFIVTPPHPEYPAAHASVTGAVMEAISRVLGNDINITDHTYDFRGWTPRFYPTLIKAGEEAGISRLYGGIHYLPSINEGLALAREIGGRIGAIKLHE